MHDDLNVSDDRGHGEVTWGQMRSQSVLPPITGDRMEIETRKWCQTTWLGKTFWKKCILTYLGRDHCRQVLLLYSRWMVHRRCGKSRLQGHSMFMYLKTRARPTLWQRSALDRRRVGCMSWRWVPIRWMPHTIWLRCMILRSKIILSFLKKKKLIIIGVLCVYIFSFLKQFIPIIFCITVEELQSISFVCWWPFTHLKSVSMRLMLVKCIWDVGFQPIIDLNYRHQWSCDTWMIRSFGVGRMRRHCSLIVFF